MNAISMPTRSFVKSKKGDGDITASNYIFDVAHRVLRKTRPGNFAVILPSCSTGVPLTTTLLIPSEK